jgi:hypothetical protein
MPCSEKHALHTDILPPAVRQLPETQQFIVLLETMIAEYAELQKDLMRATARVEALTDCVETLQATVHELTARLVEREYRDDSWLGHEW